MELKILCTKWGLEHLSTGAFFEKVKVAGYDGVDTWMPADEKERKDFIRLLAEYDLLVVSHQHQAAGNDFEVFCRSFDYQLHRSLECNPALINSHSGKDYFTIDQQLRIIDMAEDFSAKNNICVAHETHRGRIGYSPVNFRELCALRRRMNITADFSHWLCVTESYLENFTAEIDEAVRRAKHIHARVGHPQGPQVSDPREERWNRALQFSLTLWKRILAFQKFIGNKLFTITTEFGPPPYMWTSADGKPVADQWAINCFMKDLLKTTLTDEGN